MNVSRMKVQLFKKKLADKIAGPHASLVPAEVKLFAEAKSTVWYQVIRVTRSCITVRYKRPGVVFNYSFTYDLIRKATGDVRLKAFCMFNNEELSATKEEAAKMPPFNDINYVQEFNQSTQQWVHMKGTTQKFTKYDWDDTRR